MTWELPLMFRVYRNIKPGWQPYRRFGLYDAIESDAIKTAYW